MSVHWNRFVFAFAGAALGIGACSSDDGTPFVAPGDSQTPATGRNAVEDWLAEGHYKSWACEPAPHDDRSPSAHGQNRICSNAKLSAHGEGEFPVGAASVKELYEADGTPRGFAVARKVGNGNSGDAWYWYERIGSRIVADGTGVPGCAVCHGQAGSSPQHSGHDYVYTQVR